MDIKFVSYTDSPPSQWCNGKLKLIVNGKTVVFGGYNEPYEENGILYVMRFWDSGGDCYCDENCSYALSGPWQLVDADSLPDWLKPYAEELIAVMNDNVDWGCCGGCI